MLVTVVGTGYVGLVTGACLSHLGHQVTCMDVDQQKIDLLRSGRVPIYEPGLEELVAEETASERLRFVSDYAEAVPGAEAVYICVGTPSLHGGQADTSYVEAAARSLGEHLGSDYCVIINKSTVPIGSGDWVGMLVRQGIRGASLRKPEAAPVARTAVAERATATATGGDGTSHASGNGVGGGMPTTLGAGQPFDVVSNPEFLREGCALSDAFSPDRIVIGAESERAVERMRALYAPLLDDNTRRGRDVPFIVTDRASAEMVKYAANAFLATKISFINEIANVCERVGADVQEVARGIGLDARIGSNFLSAGIGWGGSCFPKDLASLVHTAREYGYDARLLDAVRDVNAVQRMAVVRKLQERLKLIKGKTIALWGLAFKPGTDDLRDAPSLAIAERLAELGATVRAYDPQAMDAARRRGLKAELCADAYEAARDADAIILVTEWPEFAAADWPRLRAVMRRPLIVDGRNTLDRATLLSHGFEHCGIGR
ncbi:MAG TPA: UDP-glucose/GDP-mannose dehydrogenase family protein [Armatimonadota bacterium]|nr:UDP-glucose/GDP-mannose dehydrogenase family protein [Armatimonadota bacterium]